MNLPCEYRVILTKKAQEILAKIKDRREQKLLIERIEKLKLAPEIFRTIGGVKLMKTSQYTSLDQELNQLSKARQEKIKARAETIFCEEIALKHLSQKLGFSQEELQQFLEKNNITISDLEHQQNLELNMLKTLVNKLYHLQKVTSDLVNQKIYP